MASSKIWRGDTTRRVAKCLLALYDQVDGMFPARDYDNDGSIGDAAHQQTNSDHNAQVRNAADGMGIVRAIDITHDPAAGFDARVFAESLRQGRDQRILNVIWDGRIFSSEVSPWVWRDRNKGPGDHSEHVHISCVDDDALYDDTRPWTFLTADGSTVAQAARRRKLKLGDNGSDVVELQRLLGVEADSFFGRNTKAAVEAFQSANGLFVDGIVGSHTWATLGAMPAKPAAGAATALSQATIDRITALAAASDLARLDWPGAQGISPLGYVKGMANVFALDCTKLKAGNAAALVMAQPAGDASRDVLAWYASELRDAGMIGDTPADRLRHLFTLMYSLGMEESSGRYCQGRDFGANNIASDEAEAGLFQQSWNSHVASPEIPKLFELYSSANAGGGFLSIFKEGVTPKSSDLITYGSGTGAAFQRLCKSNPAFAVEVAAIGLRTIGGSVGHWGPIRRKTPVLRPEADALLQQVQAVVDAIPQPRPDPILIPPPKGNPMPPDAPTPFNAAVEDAIAKIRPILEEAFAAAQSAAPTAEQVQDDIIRRLGGTPPNRTTTPLLSGPSSTGTTSAVTTTQPVRPLFANLGTAGALLSGIGGLWAAGTIPDTAAILSTAATVAATFAGIPSPVINGILSLFQRIAIKPKP